VLQRVPQAAHSALRGRCTRRRMRDRSARTGFFAQRGLLDSPRNRVRRPSCLNTPPQGPQSARRQRIRIEPARAALPEFLHGTQVADRSPVRISAFSASSAFSAVRPLDSATGGGRSTSQPAFSIPHRTGRRARGAKGFGFEPARRGLPEFLHGTQVADQSPVRISAFSVSSAFSAVRPLDSATALGQRDWCRSFHVTARCLNTRPDQKLQQISVSASLTMIELPVMAGCAHSADGAI
jgi:hypothetical protein